MNFHPLLSCRAQHPSGAQLVRSPVLIRAHLSDAFPRFACHDGVLESLDDRKKEVLISVLRRCTSMGIQSIITLIDSDLPKRAADQPLFEEDEIVLLVASTSWWHCVAVPVPVRHVTFMPISNGVSSP